MGPQIDQKASSELWRLAELQHGVLARSQLIEFGMTTHAIKHRIERGRLHPIRRGVYAVGRSTTTEYGRWMAAVLSCGPEAQLSHESAAILWGIRKGKDRIIEISLPLP